MRLYELLYIIKNDYSDEQISSIAKKISGLVQAHAPETVIVTQSLSGRRRLAYPINHETSGYYAILEFESDAKNLDKLNRDLELSEDVLRHLIVLTYKKTPEERAKEEAFREKMQMTTVIKRKHGEGIPPKKTPIKRLVQKHEDLKDDTSPADSLKELNEKLDEILKRDIVE